MLAPTDAKAEVKVGDETIVLRLNFRSIALAQKYGINLLGEAPPELVEADGLVLVKCLAHEDQPYFTEDHVVTMVAQNAEGVQKALVDLFAEYGGKAKPGNQKGRKAQA